MFFSRTFLALACMLGIANTVQAEKHFHVEANLGSVIVENLDYDGGYALDHSFAYTPSDYAMRAGILYLGEINPEDGVFDSDAEITISGAYASIARVITFPLIDLEIGGGLLYSETVAELLGRELEEDRDTSPVVNVKIIRNITEFLALQGDWKYVDDVSGGNLHLFQAGVRFSF